MINCMIQAIEAIFNKLKKQRNKTLTTLASLNPSPVENLTINQNEFLHTAKLKKELLISGEEFPPLGGIEKVGEDTAVTEPYQFRMQKNAVVYTLSEIEKMM